MELKYHHEPGKGHCLSFEFEGKKYMIAHPDYFPPAHAVYNWIKESLSEDLISQYERLSEQFNTWDPFNEEL